MPGSVIGQVAGLQNTAANLAGIAAPWITGIMIQKTGSFDAPLMAIGGFLAIGIGCYVESRDCSLYKEAHAPSAISTSTSTS